MRQIAKLIALIGGIAAAVLVGIFFVYPFVCDLSAGVDPWARYQPKVEAEYDLAKDGDEQAKQVIEDTSSQEIKCSYSIKNDPYMDNGRIIFTTDTSTTDDLLGTVVLYDTQTETTTELPGVQKKYDNLLMTQLSGNYAVWVDSLKDGGGRIVGYDLETNEQFTIKEFGYAIPEIRICGTYVVFMQIAGTDTQRLYLYDLKTRENTTVKLYSGVDVVCGNADVSATDMVWSEYGANGRAVLNRYDFASGRLTTEPYRIDDWVFEPRTNGEAILYTTTQQPLDGDLMLCRKGETPVKIASGVLDYDLSEDFVVYSVDQTLYVVSIDKLLKPEQLSSTATRATFASMNGNELCFYDVTDGLGRIEIVRYMTLDGKEE